jgi:hypothetical protein
MTKKMLLREIQDLERTISDAQKASKVALDKKVKAELDTLVTEMNAVLQSRIHEAVTRGLCSHAWTVGFND